MNVNENNTVFLTVAAWPDWETKTEIFLRSAKKQDVPVELLDKNEPWKGYYHHKIVRMKERLAAWQNIRPEIKYVVFTDSRDVVYVKPKREILSLLADASDEKVLFALDNRFRTWPMQKTWLAHRIALKYGFDGVLNSGCYAGRIDHVIELFSECIRIHEILVTGNRSMNSVLKMVHNELKPEYLYSDQFHLHVAQALWSDRIAVDEPRKVFACFKGGFPPLKTGPQLGSCGEMPLGTAGILHSPWMLHRDKHSKKDMNAWRNWAIDEGIVDE